MAQRPIDRTKFFTPVRQLLFGGILRQSQVDGMNAILDGWEQRYPEGDLRWLAYQLATTAWETAHTMQPIHEYGGDAYFFRMYDPEGERGDFARRNGNTQPGDGVRFHGRGYVQLTWRSNYERMGQLLGVDLVGNPDLALDPRIAADIMFVGMERGLFTGVGLPRFFSGSTANWKGARAIINGDGDADRNGIADSIDIGCLGQSFHEILRAAR